MNVNYLPRTSLSRLRPNRQWLYALAIALILESGLIYIATRKDVSTFSSNRPDTVLTLSPLVAQAVFPTAVKVTPVSIKSSISRRAPLAVIPVPKTVATTLPTPASSADGSVIISPDAPGTGSSIDVGGVPTNETTGTTTPPVSSSTPVANDNTNTGISTGLGNINTTSGNSGSTTTNINTNVPTSNTSSPASTSVSIPSVSVPPVTVGPVTLP